MANPSRLTTPETHRRPVTSRPAAHHADGRYKRRYVHYGIRIYQPLSVYLYVSVRLELGHHSTKMVDLSGVFSPVWVRLSAYLLPVVDGTHAISRATPSGGDRNQQPPSRDLHQRR